MLRCYGNLKLEMARRGIAIESIAQLLGIHRNSASNKVNGKSSFTIEEAFVVQKTFFPDLETQYLFDRNTEALVDREKGA